MITLLIGHRGTGKTTLLTRLARYHREAGRVVETVDLDSYLEWKQEASVTELFARGEEAFRRLETEALSDLVNRLRERNTPAFIAVGAGCLGPFEGARCLWVRRDADSLGRVFTDRPRLDPTLSPAQEYLARFPEREARYQRAGDEVLTLREGFDGPNEAERRFFLDEWRSVGGVITVLPEVLRLEAEFRSWLERRIRWGVELFEIRDDLLSPDERALAMAHVPRARRLVSFRASGNVFSVPESRWDWPCELGPCPSDRPDILSLHARASDETFRESAERLVREGANAKHLKLAVRVDSFAELEEGDAWACVEPTRRSFLPVSSDGRWAWYRLRAKGRQPLGFFREGYGSAADQPPLLAWADALPRAERFAAVLGDPIDHSRTPAEQREFFRAWKMPVFAIRVSKTDWENGALATLERMGLTHAAVTSPLKELAFAACSKVDASARELGAVNTIAIAPGTRHGTNTDLQGLVPLVKRQGDGQDTAVWGGGGTLAALRRQLPSARFYSAREGTNRDGDDDEEWRPRYLVWAAGDPSAPVPGNWKPESIVDLSYREDSPARTLARTFGAHYVSGIALFRAQAEGQRKFWNEERTA